MKIQYLAVIFIIIIMPIIMVFSEFLGTQINIIKTEESYDAKLLNSTYDCIKALQLNTINSSIYTPDSRVSNIEAAVNTFYNSLTTSFKYEGNYAEVMKEYIPAVVFTMYDGYYIYSPFENQLTNVKSDDVDSQYTNGRILSGLKPYVSYTGNYSKDGKNYMITYTMDNYIIVDVFDDTGNHETHEGYLINGIEKNGDGDNATYTYDGITFTKNNTEILKEFLGNDFFFYTIKDGTKYYYNGSHKNGNYDPNAEDESIFYIDEQRYAHVQYKNQGIRKKEFKEYYDEIFNNDYAYNYYKEAFDFTKWVNDNLSGLTIANIKKESQSYAEYKFAEVGNIFEGNIQDSDSNFNAHRADLIRAIISTNLPPAISGFGKFSKATNTEFLMPKISETDWELLENNICVATFLQGMKVGDKTYNNYAVVPNNFNKEYVDENDIYILKKDNTYTKPNDSALDTDSIQNKGSLGFEPGVLKINFERRQNINDEYFNPVSVNENTPYLLSYSSLAGTGDLNSLSTIDMYKYMRSLTDEKYDNLKKAYYTALGRERYGSYKVSK